MKNIVAVLSLIICFHPCRAQKDNPLFSAEDPIQLRATGSVKNIRKETNDTTFVNGKFLYEKTPGEWITIDTEARVRGNFRLKNCYFPPLKLKFKKKSIESTVFEGNKSVKLVLPCKNNSSMNTQIRKEYLCYKFYEAITPYHFKTRLANLQLTETTKSKPRVFDLLSILVEDNDKVAKRTNGKIIEVKGLGPGSFDEKQSLRNDYFQYLIGNTDWSTVFQHNSNILLVGDAYLPLPYDFDMAGLVNASYMQVSSEVSTGDPRDRVYRGFCKSPASMEEIRKEYLTKESVIQALIAEQSSQFKEYDVKDIHNYVNQFYDILKSDDLFKTRILEGCRK